MTGGQRQRPMADLLMVMIDAADALGIVQVVVRAR
jgi:hypothetical protein